MQLTLKVISSSKTQNAVQSLPAPQTLRLHTGPLPLTSAFLDHVHIQDLQDSAGALHPASRKAASLPTKRGPGDAGCQPDQHLVPSSAGHRPSV